MAVAGRVPLNTRLCGNNLTSDLSYYSRKHCQRESMASICGFQVLFNRAWCSFSKRWSDLESDGDKAVCVLRGPFAVCIAFMKGFRMTPRAPWSFIETITWWWLAVITSLQTHFYTARVTSRHNVGICWYIRSSSTGPNLRCRYSDKEDYITMSCWNTRYIFLSTINNKGNLPPTAHWFLFAISYCFWLLLWDE